MSGAERGRGGRLLAARIGPNEDLVQTVEKLCLAHGLRHALVRGSLGSLTQAGLAGADGSPREVPGPAVEVLTLAGEVRTDAGGSPRAGLDGVVMGPDGVPVGGRFVTGRNPVCMTFELVLEEWLPDGEGRG